jgi:hypothetical protein
MRGVFTADGVDERLPYMGVRPRGTKGQTNEGLSRGASIRERICVPLLLGCELYVFVPACKSYVHPKQLLIFELPVACICVSQIMVFNLINY